MYLSIVVASISMTLGSNIGCCCSLSSPSPSSSPPLLVQCGQVSCPRPFLPALSPTEDEKEEEGVGAP